MLRVQEDSRSVLLKGMEGSTLGVWVQHGEGQVSCPSYLYLYELHQMKGSLLLIERIGASYAQLYWNLCPRVFLSESSTEGADMLVFWW